ncbi:LBP / BPI / CETP family protein [Dirofilaria immitis]|nr:LBP / BPI / CETP family protein [Dirofilaria immitis]
MNNLISLFLIVLLSCPIISNAIIGQNSPGRPSLASFVECRNYMFGNGNASRVNLIDFNPILQSNGYIGYPGIKIRFNANAFRYANSIIAQFLNQGIRNVQIPPFTQSLPEVNGYTYLTNIMITNYRCPRRIVLFPIPYNQLVLNIQNFDLRLNGQLGGQVVILLPIPLCGTLCVDARQISVSVAVTIDRNPYNGMPYVRMSRCSVTLGYLNIYIVNGGLTGEIINNNFRNKIISKAYEMLPGKVCNMIPKLLDERVNSRLATTPHQIPFMQMLPYASFLISKPEKLPDYCYSEICKHYQSANISLANKFKSKSAVTAGVPMANFDQKSRAVIKSEHLSNETLLESAAAPNGINHKSTMSAKMLNKFSRKNTLANVRNNQWQQCANCDYERSEILAYYSNDIMRRLQICLNLFYNKLLFTCAADLDLSTYFLGSSTTNYDLILNLLAEFSPNARGGTPFAPPILHYPISDSGQMLDLLISDYTLNTLLYHLHRKGIFTFRIGPEISTVGDLLNLTCSAEEFDFDLSVEMQENSEELTNETKSNYTKVRNKRRVTADTLLNFGICFGDIAPAIRTIIIESIFDGFIFLDGTTTQVGHFRITTVLAITIQVIGGRITGKAQIQRLELIDVDETFGIPREAFTNLSDLARGLLLE